MAPSSLTVSSGVKRELHLLRCSSARKAHRVPGPSARCLPGGGCLTQLVTFCLLSPGSLGHHSPLLPALLLAPPGLKAAASHLARLWRQREASLPQASGVAFSSWGRGGARGRRWWPHLPTAARPAPLGSLEGPQVCDRCFHRCFHRGTQPTARPGPGLAAHRTAPPRPAYRLSRKRKWSRLGSAGGNRLGASRSAWPHAPSRALAAAGGDRASLPRRVCGCHPGGPPPPSSRPERPEVPGRLLPGTPTNLTIVYLNGL